MPSRHLLQAFLQALALLLSVAAATGAGPAQAAETRFALAPEACTGDLETRDETPLVIEGNELRWFNLACEIVSSYKVGDAFFLQARCTAEGKTATIPVRLERNGNGLKLGWNREPVRDMQRCPADSIGFP